MLSENTNTLDEDKLFKPIEPMGGAAMKKYILSFFSSVTLPIDLVLFCVNGFVTFAKVPISVLPFIP